MVNLQKLPSVWMLAAVSILSGTMAIRYRWRDRGIGAVSTNDDDDDDDDVYIYIYIYICIMIMNTFESQACKIEYKKV